MHRTIEPQNTPNWKGPIRITESILFITLNDTQSLGFALQHAKKKDVEVKIQRQQHTSPSLGREDDMVVVLLTNA